MQSLRLARIRTRSSHSNRQCAGVRAAKCRHALTTHARVWYTAPNKPVRSCLPQTPTSTPWSHHRMGEASGSERVSNRCSYAVTTIITTYIKHARDEPHVVPASCKPHNSHVLWALQIRTDTDDELAMAAAQPSQPKESKVTVPHQLVNCNDHNLGKHKVLQ